VLEKINRAPKKKATAQFLLSKMESYVNKNFDKSDPRETRGNACKSGFVYTPWGQKAIDSAQCKDHGEDPGSTIFSQ